jgi:tight adherence protein C
MLALVFAVAAVVGGIGIGAYALTGRVPAPQAAGLGIPPSAVALEGAGLRPGSSVHRSMATLGGTLSRPGYRQRIQARLDRAGNPRAWGPDRLLAAKGFGVVAGVVLGLIFGSKQGGALTFLAPIGVGAFGLFVPDIYLHNLGQKRQIELQKGLPDALDMMTICVEAGLGFDASLIRVARNLKGPMAEECARALQEMQMGLSRAEALRSLLERTDVVELRVFVSAVIQSSELGISIADVLREQAAQMRVKRRHRAEEKAQKLQVKLLFPLITCLLPAMFVVILGPAIIQIAGFFQQASH